MKENKNDWTDELRNHLENYQAPVDEELWADIEQSFARQQHSAKVVSRSMLWRKWSVAASLALLLIGGSYVLLRHTSHGTSPLYTSSSASSALSATAKMQDAQEGQDVKGQDAPVLLATTVRPTTDSPVAPNTETQDIAVMSAEDVLPVEVSGATGEEEQTVASSSKSKKRTQEDLVTDAYALGAVPQAMQQAEEKMAVSQSYARAKVGVKLYAENGLMGKQPSLGGNGVGVLASPMVGSMADAKYFVSSYPQQAENISKPAHTKHHFPLSVGMQVTIPLYSHLSLYTGVAYTRTTSDFTWQYVDGTTSAERQTLHYIGIPLGISYEVWRMARLHTYANMGVEGAVNVKNQTEVDGTSVEASRDRMQWSGNLSVGVQYDVIPKLGIYVEPGVKYYINNGSQIDNIFKDKKFNFNFQFGLRTNF